MEQRSMHDEVSALKTHALENYEAGGHWVYETYSDLDYADVVFVNPSLQAAKDALKKHWELVNEHCAECRWD
jgi:hypothetical protein